MRCPDALAGAAQASFQLGSEGPGPPDPTEQAPPTLFPALSAEEAAEEFEYLRGNSIRDWLHMVREDIPELAPEIDLVLARKG